LVIESALVTSINQQERFEDSLQMLLVHTILISR
jgi:hypothetical protein